MSAAETKHTCARCLRGQHAECTAPETCECTTCNPPVVVWEEPPPDNRRSHILTDAQIAECKAHPKRWIRAKEYAKKGAASSVAHYLRVTGSGNFAPGEWEATGRSNGTGSVLYLRYVGPAT